MNCLFNEQALTCDGQTKLLRKAIRRNRLSRIRRHLKSLSKQDREDLSHILTYAVRLANKAAISVLARAGVPIDPMAVKIAVALEDQTVLLHLLDAGWDINRPLGPQEPPVLSMALNDKELTMKLLSLGASPNAPCENMDLTPLSTAVLHHDLETVQQLIEHSKKPHNGHLVYYAVIRNTPDLRIVALLLQSGTPFDEVAFQDERSFRLRAHFPMGTPLYEACRLAKTGKNLEICELLLQQGANPDKPCRRWNVEVAQSSPRCLAQEDRELLEMMHTYAPQVEQ